MITRKRDKLTIRFGKTEPTELTAEEAHDFAQHLAKILSDTWGLTTEYSPEII